MYTIILKRLSSWDAPTAFRKKNVFFSSFEKLIAMTTEVYR